LYVFETDPKILEVATDDLQEEKKDSLRKKRKGKDAEGVDTASKPEIKPFKPRKRVSFG